MNKDQTTHALGGGAGAPRERCTGGGILQPGYLAALQPAGVGRSRTGRNDYRSVSERALAACSRYTVENVLRASIMIS